MSGSPPGPVAVLAAQRDEVGPLLARLAARRTGTDASAEYWRGEHGGVEVWLAVGGMGSRRARAAAAALLDRSAATLLLVTGVAGALTEGLDVGTVIVADATWSETGERLPTDRRALAAAVALGARPAAVLSVDRMIATAAERAALLRAFASAHAPVAAAVVDMESHDAATVAAARGVAVVVLRAVSDGAAEALPAFLPGCRRADGDLDRPRVIVHALARPWRIPALLELRRRVRAGARAVAAVAPGLLERVVVDGARAGRVVV